MNWVKVISDYWVTFVIVFAVILILSAMFGFFELAPIPDGFYPEDFSSE